MEAPRSTVDVETDRKFQKRFWIVVRIGWVAMIVILISAILGFTGSGGAYSAQKLAAGETIVDIPAVSRWAASDTMTIKTGTLASRTTVLVPAGFGEVFSLESINPQPRSVSAGPEGDEFVFQLKPGDGEISIEFSLRASRPVWQHQLGPFRVNGDETEVSSVTVLP